MKKSFVDNNHEKSRRDSQIVSLKVVKNHAIRSANANCVWSNGYSEGAKNLTTNGLGESIEVSSANIDVNQSTAESDLIDDLRQCFQVVIFHTEMVRNLPSSSRIKTTRDPDKFLKSSSGIFDRD